MSYYLMMRVIYRILNNCQCYAIQMLFKKMCGFYKKIFVWLVTNKMNQKVEIWNAEELFNGSPKTVLSGHTRSISDINWSYFEPYTLLTCSMDMYINLWDVRQTRKPSSLFTTVAGSSQVKWNRRNKNLFASAHDGDVRIWDIRNGNNPLVYIAGHLSKIHGLDWSPQNESQFVTASNDSTVKFWNINSPLQSQGSINTGSPVWKARFTPFGIGLVTVQLRRGDNNIFLWKTSELKSPVHRFDGHTDVILEFQWRSQHLGDEEEYQLISWSKDETLKIWRIEKKTIQAITGKYNKSSKPSFLNESPVSIASSSYDTPEKYAFTSNNLIPTINELHFQKEKLDRPDKLDILNQHDSVGQHDAVGQEDAVGQYDAVGQHDSVVQHVEKNSLDIVAEKSKKTPINQIKCETKNDTYDEYFHMKNLNQEFALINLISPLYKVNMDPDHRKCTVVTNLHGLMKLKISFPASYPDKIAPNFQFSKSSKTNLDLDKILKGLEELSLQHVKFNRPCLEPCLRYLKQQIEGFMSQDSVKSDDISATTPSDVLPSSSFTFRKSDTSDYSSLDYTVPFPRTCGARFCGVGDRLVVFARPAKFNNIISAERSSRSLSALYAYYQKISDDGQFDSSVYNENGTGSYKQLKAVGLVYITDTSSLLPVSKELAQTYRLSGDCPSNLCLQNATQAESIHRQDLVQMWLLLSKVMSPDPTLKDDLNGPPWACNPLGRMLINSLFTYYESVKDVQTLAMMSCILSQQELPDEFKTISSRLNVEESKNMKQCFSDGFQVSPEFPFNVYNKNSIGEGSWSPPTFVEEKNVDTKFDMLKQNSQNWRLLSSDNTFRYDQFKRFYGQILYRWKFNLQRTEVMKYVTEFPNKTKHLDLFLECNTCKTSQRELYCTKCRSVIVKCSVCRLCVKGLLSFCIVCGHGGHMFHLQGWFRQHDWCASGCGCYCVRIGKFSSE
ncbi:GATOR2 complex protein WDR59 isoform X2 [Hydra vulgaris]|uniref:GATOR2 complex protein WDR59 isoform X2 n=1 Tax=Hydra vulgaris TaxID=6087 RepID=UPI0032EA7981